MNETKCEMIKGLVEHLWQEKDISTYTKNEKNIIYKRYYEGNSVNKVSEELNKSTTYIRKVIKRLNDGKFTSVIVALNCDFDGVEVKEDTIEVANELKRLTDNLNYISIAVLYINNSFCRIVKVKDVIDGKDNKIIRYDEIYSNKSARINMTILGDWIYKTMNEPIVNLTSKNLFDICKIL